jgi:phage terminase large subunit-like protein
MIRRRTIALRAREDRALVAYERTGKYPIRGKSRHFSWDCWVNPKRDRTPKAEADRAVAFISSLTFSRGPDARKPFRLRPWQEKIIRQIFGTLGPDGFRQYRTVFITCPRKSGKTELCAAVTIYLLMGDGEQGGELYGAASDLDQAALLFNTVAQMIRHDPELAARLEVIPSRKRIIHHASGSVYRAIPADAPSAHGFNASGIVADELHAWPNRELWDVLQTSTGARLSPLVVAITTAGSDPHSVCAEVHRYAVAVRDGLVPDASFLPVIFAAPEDADWRDEAVWRACNPALGDFRSLEEMRVACRQAQEIPGREAAFKRLYLNMWTTAAEARWLPMDKWDLCAGPVDPAALRGQPVIVGLDLSTTTDLSAMVLLFPPDEAGIVEVLVEYWCPGDYLELRQRRDRVPYVVWAQEGHLHVTRGNVVDYTAIEKRLHDLVAVDGYDVIEVAVDPWNAKGLLTKLQGDGVPAVEVPQTMANLSGASKELERLILSGQIRHTGHPILRWNVSNCVVDTDANDNRRPSKKRSAERIDGVSALVTAIARASVPREAPAEPRVSVFG